MKSAAFPRAPRLLAAALALSFVTACGDDEKPTDPGPTAPTTPLYAVVTQVSTSDDPQSYIVVTDKVDQTESLNLTTAIEINGRALGSGVPKSGSLYVSSSEGADVSRYALTTDGKLEKKETVSFSGKGVTSIGEYQGQFQFVSSTKAYYFDGRTAQAIVWNPTDMTVTGSIPLGDVTIANAITTFATAPIRLEGQVLMPIGWRPSAGIGITKQAGLVVVNTANDTAKVIKDDRCGYVRDGVVGPDGLVYLATEAYGAAVYRMVGGETPVPCLLRYDPKTQAFDPTFFRDLSSLTGGAATGSLLAGPQGTAYLRVLDETSYTVVPGTHPRAVASAQAWRFWQLNLTNFTAALVDTLPASTGSTFLYDVADGRTLFTEFTNSSTTTNFRELSGHKGQVTMTTQGLSFSFLQLR